MKAIVIDDEIKARNILKILINENCKRITSIIEASNLLDGISLIKEEQPQIVFLDIEMPEHSGLEILDFIDKDSYNFEIIFTTAYNEHAITAIQLSALDYLLKPISPNQLKKAVDKTIEFIGKSNLNKKMDLLKNSLQAAEFQKIGIPFSDGIRFENFKDIIFFEADGMYTKITTKSKNEILVSKPLKHFVTILEKINIFYRPHRSYLINLKYIKEYIRKEGGYIVLDNDKIIPIAREKKEEFLTIISNLTQ